MPGARCVRLCLTLIITSLLSSVASAQSISPNGASAPPLPSIVDTSGATWTIGAQLEILRNGVQIGGGWGSQILWLDGVIYVLGSDINWYSWNGSMWVFQSDAPVSAAPPSDLSGECAATWTVSSNLWILRNGQPTGGVGSQIVCAQNVVYALGSDKNWWRWTGSSWAFAGATMPAGATSLLTSDGSSTAPPSEDGSSTSPPALTGECAATWTIDADQLILRNGAFTGGVGSQIVCAQNVVYGLGTDNNWWRWSGSSWSFSGATMPAGATSLLTSQGSSTAPPSGGGSSTSLPALTGECAATWTVSSNLWILRDGQPTGGVGSQIVCAQNVVYVLGGDNNWWRWTGSTWQMSGSTMPIGASPLTASAGGGSSTPPPSGLTGECAATWTIGSDQLILRNGAFTGGIGSQIVCAQDTVYGLGTDNNWWRWDNGTWQLTGASMPAGATSLTASSGGTTAPLPPASSNPQLLVFSPAEDHGTNVDSYELRILAVGPDQISAAQLNLGKPPVVNGECTVDISELLSRTSRFFDNYVAVVTAINGYGSSAQAVSAPFMW